MRISDSPDDEVTIRSKDDQRPPEFRGVSVLPSPLTKLFETSRAQAMPSRGEFTALASRLRRVHIDDTPARARTAAGGVIGPGRLSFDDADDDAAPAAVGKENARRNPFGGFAALHPKDVPEPQGPPLVDVSPNVLARVPSPSRPPASASTPAAAAAKKRLSFQPPAFSPGSAGAPRGSPAPSRPASSPACATVPTLSAAQLAAPPAGGGAGGAPTLSARGAPMDFTPAARDAAPAPSPMNVSDTPVAGPADAAAGHLAVVLAGAGAHSWQARCGALDALARAVTGAPGGGGAAAAVCDALDALTDALISHLGESRPSVIRSALALVEALVAGGAAGSASTADRVFDEVLDLVCGQSLTATDATGTLAVLLAHNPRLAPRLRAADNPARVLQLLRPAAAAGTYSAEQKEALEDAVEIVVRLVEGPEDSPGTPAVESRPEDEASASLAALETPGNSPPERDSDATASSEADGVSVNFMETQAHTLPVSETVNEEAPQLSERASEETEENDGLESKSSTGDSTGSAPVSHLTTSEVPEVRKRDHSLPPKTPQRPRSVSLSMGSTSLGEGMRSLGSLRKRSSSFVTPRAVSPGALPTNKRLSSARRLSPNSLRRVKRYTAEDLEEAQRVATLQAEEKIKEKIVLEREKFEKQLSAERKDKEELHSVLAEFESTMSKMAADKRSSQREPMHAMLDMEVNRLKTELFETSQAFTKLKERYAEAKEVIAVMEGKESRVVEQNHELRQSLIELQKWSNDLKANTEKKLAKSFEAVSEYRSASMDREARAEKALSELKLANRDLEQQKAACAETATKLSGTEVQLHESQDLATSLQAALDVAQVSLKEAEADRASLRDEADSSRLQLARMQDEFDRMKESEAKASDAVLKVASLEIENRSLKANAYDQMTKNRKLEKKLADKDKECDELNSICEELLSNLEKGKLPNA